MRPWGPAGVRKVRTHDFRHGCVSVLLGLGATSHRHGDHQPFGYRDDNEHLAHVTLDDKRDALDKLDALFGDDE